MRQLYQLSHFLKYLKKKLTKIAIFSSFYWLSSCFLHHCRKFLSFFIDTMSTWEQIQINQDSMNDLFLVRIMENKQGTSTKLKGTIGLHLWFFEEKDLREKGICIESIIGIKKSIQDYNCQNTLSEDTWNKRSTYYDPKIINMALTRYQMQEKWKWEDVQLGKPLIRIGKDTYIWGTDYIFEDITEPITVREIYDAMNIVNTQLWRIRL